MKKVNNESFKFGQIRAMIEVTHLIFKYAPENAMDVYKYSKLCMPDEK